MPGVYVGDDPKIKVQIARRSEAILRLRRIQTIRHKAEEAVNVIDRMSKAWQEMPPEVKKVE